MQNSKWVHGREDFFCKTWVFLALIYIAERVADSPTTVTLCGMEAGSTVGNEGMVLMPSYTICHAKSTPEIPS